jgi:quinoprotein glucose dehydrogenase
VPTEGAPPEEHLSPTQPFPTKPAPYSRLGFHEEDVVDFTPAIKAEAMKFLSEYTKGPMYSPPTVVTPTNKGTIVYPNYGGGSNWNGGAVDLETNTLFVPTRNTFMAIGLRKTDPTRTDWTYAPVSSGVLRLPSGIPVNKPPWALVTATDMNRGEHIWSRAIGSAPDGVREHPDLQGLGLDFDAMGHPGVRPSPLVTKTLLFLAESGNLTGDPGGPMLRAYDKATGEVVAEIELPGKASGAPMTYWHQGRQYIVIAVSSREHPAELVALALPEAGAPGVAAGHEPEAVPRAPQAPEAPGRAVVSSAELSGTQAQGREDDGRTLYSRWCATCHGDTGQGAADLSSPPVRGLRDLEEIVRFVSEGGIEMPAMKTRLTSDEIDSVSRFVLSEWGSR